MFIKGIDGSAESAGLGRASRFASSGGPKPKLSVSVHCRCGGVPSSLLRFSIFLQFLRREWFGWLLGSLGVPTGGFGCCLCSGMLAGLATTKGTDGFCMLRSRFARLP